MTRRSIIPVTVLATALAAAPACSRPQERVVDVTGTSGHAAMAPAHTHGAGAQRPARGAATIPAKRYDGPLPPLPTPSFTPPRSPDVVRATYEFAARRPDVLQYVPCFCMCERSGHVGNDDCFVSGRDETGRPSWDLHGMG